MGLRLPLDSLPWVRPQEYPYLYPPDPTLGRDPLPVPQSVCVVPTAPVSADPVKAQTIPPDETKLDPAGTVRTALCVEPRNGCLHIFMPPVRGLEDYLELVGVIEETAAALQVKVILEGYPPPHDPRVEVLKVTPDPGVIEVNMPPAQTWDQLVHQTQALYEEARHIRLGTEKFLLDGRHVGTGGGNHIVLGGPTPADSPLLRRPDLLRSLVTFWHNHPSLSYLFSGLFIGPSSQAPRIDEARDDSVYEMEIALSQLTGVGDLPPWFVDRVLRHLLVDVTGNTHRAEFCIDKLYSPDSAAGRLGLLELRAFEMPPHERMSLVQQLFLRACVIRFWRQPLRQSLVRWGTTLHDKFLLPHFVWDDFCSVLAELKDAGYPLKEEWFAPHFEFRFPLYGDVVRGGVHVELRGALEPWHVLGEEGVAGSTVRFVDSSVERLQVRVNGLVTGRHLLACNGKVVPLQPTGRAGEAVAGIRFRAWQPASCLHPHLPVQAPLVFDLFDGWNGRSLGGCTYHVAHPGGRNFDQPPVNSFEAESRRLARFLEIGHTPGKAMPEGSEQGNEFPMTLDLRK